MTCPAFVLVTASFPTRSRSLRFLRRSSLFWIVLVNTISCHRWFLKERLKLLVIFVILIPSGNSHPWDPSHVRNHFKVLPYDRYIREIEALRVQRMRHSQRVQTENQAKHMEYILQIAHQIAPWLVLYQLLFGVQTIKLLQIFHPFSLRLVGEYYIFSFELSLLNPALWRVFSR